MLEGNAALQRPKSMGDTRSRMQTAPIGAATMDRPSRLNLMERLRREGRWRAANEFKERERQRLRAEGCRRREAVEQSWLLMETAFPPLVQDPGLEDISYRAIPLAEPVVGRPWSFRDDLY